MMSKQTISKAEFTKRVEIEIAHLVYFDRLNKREAEEEAVSFVSTKFVAKEDKR